MDAEIRQSVAPSVRKLRVALVHDWLTGIRGGEKCLDVLCRAFPDARLFTLIHRKGALTPEIEAMDIHPSPLQHIPGIFDHYRKFLPIMPLAAKSWRVGEVDLVVSMSHCVAKSIRVPAGVPHVCYCFTPMRYAWDGREAYLAHWKGRSVKQTAVRLLLDHLRDWDRRTAQGVTHFISISETIRERIQRCYGRESTVIQPPVDSDFYTPTNSTRGDFYLCVSALVPYKRIDQAVEACTRSGRRLIVIGSGPEADRLKALAGPTVQLLGWQPDEVIRDHYRACRALLFPGEEDFGIVPVEALACGTPVISLGRGGAAETVDHRVGATYAEPTVDGLVEALNRWEAAGCPNDPAEGRRRAEELDLVHFRARLLGFLDGVLRSGSEGRAIPAPHVRPGRKPVEQVGERF